MNLFKEWQPNLHIDMHCPWLRGNFFQKYNTNEYVYQVGQPPPADNKEMRAFAKCLEESRLSALEYHAADDLGFNVGWNSPGNYDQGMPLTMWVVKCYAKCLYATTFEIPFANQRFYTLHVQDFKAFGRDIAAGLKKYLETKEKR